MTATGAGGRGSWRTVALRGPVGELHHRPMAAGGRRVEVLAWQRPTLVLGSTQPLTTADPAAADRVGADVVRRRSGGGAVLLVPGEDLWVDVTVPRSDPLWDDDVAVAFRWLGRAWAGALAALGVDAVVHEGPPVSSRWSRRVCFAGVGSGEVLVDGRKVLGLSQRRTRDAARFQCLVPGRWDPARLLRLLALDDDERAAALPALADVAAGVELPHAGLLAALLSHLPA